MAKKIICLLKFFLFIISFATEWSEVFSENVPDQHGEAIYIKTLNPHSRSASHKITFSSNGTTYNFNFVRIERNVFTRNTSVWLIEGNPQNPLKNNYRLLNEAEKSIEGNVYVDYNNSAVFLIRYDNKRQKYFYDGVFGIKQQKQIIRSNSKGSDFIRKTNSADHLIFRSARSNYPVDLPPPLSKFVWLENDGVEALEKVDKPLETLYPKIVVVVDHTIFELMGRNVKDILKYVTVFWNVVDQKYAQLAHPKVEISLAGVVIATSEKSLDFIYNSRNFPSNGNEINVTRYAANSATYFYQDFSSDLQFNNYDAALVMSKFDLKFEGSGLNILGIANSIGYICRRGLNVAIGNDDAKYYGTDTLIHELGHLLNLYHDDYTYYFNRCGPITRDEHDKPISQSVMSPEYGLPTHWSECSIASLTRLASYKVGQCLGRR